MTKQAFSAIYVIESLKPCDLKTGESLYYDKIVHLCEANSLGHAFAKPADAQEFRAALRAIAQDCRQNPEILPWIHIDAHGCDDRDGLILTSGEFIPWADLAEECRTINSFSRNNLVVVLAACFGLEVVTVDAMAKLDRVGPFFAMVGPPDGPSAGQIEAAFPGFYDQIFTDGDMGKAMASIRVDFGDFMCERLFLRVIARYFKDNCTGEALEKRLDDLVKRAIEAHPEQADQAAQFRREAEKQIMPSAATFLRYKNAFLMADHPDNVGRFPSTFDQAMAIP